MATRTPIPAQPIVAPARSTASVIDTFTVATPDPNAGAKAERLAQSLGILGQALAPQARALKKQQEEAEFERGKAVARTGILEDGTKIRKGEMPPTGSFYFMKGFNQERGYNRAIAMGTEIEKRWKALDPQIKNSTDPKVYNDWLTGQFSELGGDTTGLNGDVLVGMSNGLASVRQNMVAKQNAYMTALVEEESLTQLNDKVGYAIDNNKGDDLSDELKAIGTSDYLRGIDPEQAKETVFTAALAKAMERGDADILDAIPKNLRNAEINAKIIDAKQDIKAYNYQQSEIARTARIRQQEAKANDFYKNDIIPKLIEDPYTVFDQATLQVYEDIEPGLANRALDAQRRLQSNEMNVDPRAEQLTVDRLTVMANRYSVTGAREDNPSRALIDAINNGKIKSPAAMKAVQAAIAASEVASPYMQHKAITEGSKRVDLLFKQASPGVFDQPRLRNEVMEAYENYVINAISDELQGLAEGDRLNYRQLVAIQREGYDYITNNFGAQIGSTPNVGLPNAPQPGQIKRDKTGVTFFYNN